MSNKLGGAHYELDKKKMARMSLLLDVKDAYVVLKKNAIYFEILSIGQLLVKSKYTDKLTKKIDSLIKDVKSSNIVSQSNLQNS